MEAVEEDLGLLVVVAVLQPAVQAAEVLEIAEGLEPLALQQHKALVLGLLDLEIAVVDGCTPLTYGAEAEAVPELLETTKQFRETLTAVAE